MTSIIKIRPVLTFPAKHCVRLASSSTVHEDVVRRKMLEKIIRVDHAGEMGASYIYKGNKISAYIIPNPIIFLLISLYKARGGILHGPRLWLTFVLI